MFGMGLGVAPVFLELGVECTYPVPEATSAGFMWLVGLVVKFIYILLTAKPVILVGIFLKVPHPYVNLIRPNLSSVTKRKLFYCLKAKACSTPAVRHIEKGVNP